MIARIHAIYCWVCACGWISPNGHNADRPAATEVAKHRRLCSEAVYTTRMWEHRTVVQIIHPVVCECEEWRPGFGGISQITINATMAHALVHNCVKVDP